MPGSDRYGICATGARSLEGPGTRRWRACPCRTRTWASGRTWRSTACRWRQQSSGAVVEASAGAAPRNGGDLRPCRQRIPVASPAVPTRSPLTRTVDLVPGTNRIEVEVVAEDEQVSRVYGVTVTRDEDPAGRGQPQITGPALFEVLEGDVAVAKLAATDADTPRNGPRWSIQGGVDFRPLHDCRGRRAGLRGRKGFRESGRCRYRRQLPRHGTGQ